MPKRTGLPVPPLPPRLLAAALMLAGPAWAEGETSPWYVGAAAGLTHVANIYRLPAANQPLSQPNSDDVTTLTLLAGLDKPLGRQRLHADASVRRNAYRRDASLDNTSYTLSAGLDWAALDKLGGRLTLRSNRNLAQYNPSAQVEQITQKNIEQNDQLQLSARYGLAGRLALEGGAAHQRRDYSAEAYRLLNFRQDSVFAGLSWRSSGALNFGLNARHTEGSGYARVFVFVLPNDYRRQDLELNASWVASAASTLNARLGASHIQNGSASLDNYSGLTGRLSWQWQPTAKLQFNTVLARDTIQENYLSGGALGSAEINRVSDSLQLGASYTLSAKLLIDAGLNLSRLSRDGASLGDDRSQAYSLGLRWLPTRATQLGCQLSRERRDSDFATLNYSASSYGCHAQLLLR